jgi:hypothetical protein
LTNRSHGSGRYRGSSGYELFIRVCCHYRRSRTCWGSGRLTLGPSSGTWTMPAAGMFETEAGTLSYFRPMRPEPGNLLARARVINASRFFVFSEVEIEDPQGRLIARASSHLELRRIEPPPPAELHSIASVSSPASRRNASPGKKMTGIPVYGCSPRAPSGHHINTALPRVGGRSKAR